MTRTLLGPLSLMYRVATQLRNRKFDRIEPLRLRDPVISVGNLSVGGAGKTPVVIRLAQLLSEREFAVDVLSRGYSRRGTQPEQVDADGSALQFGDEPLLIARTARVPVFVAARRYQAGLLAEAQPAARRVHLLDDGFQHRELARTLDVVLALRSDPSDQLLPMGRLREPLSSLRRADVLVLREEDAECEGGFRRYTRPECLVLRVRRSLEYEPRGPRALAFCGIARPADFYAQLDSAGAQFAGHVSFRDHHGYTAADAARLARMAHARGATEFVTTEKDAVRFAPEFRSALEAVAPITAAKLVVRFVDEDASIDSLLELLKRRMQHR